MGSGAKSPETRQSYVLIVYDNTQSVGDKSTVRLHAVFIEPNISPFNV